MNEKLKLYPLGYIFSEEKLSEIPKHYSEYKVLKYYYYFDKDIPKSIYKSKESFIIIHGDFKHIGLNSDIDNEDLPRILLEAYENDYKNFLSYLDFITGRFTILMGDYENVAIYPDATNARSNYYSLDRLAVSSHVDFLATSFKYEENKSIPDDFKDILLTTQYDQIKSTIPNHFTDLITKIQTRFFPREENLYTKLSEEKRFEIFENIWQKQMDYFFNEYDDIIFSLTGGGDSRFSFAMLKEYKHRVKFFTYALYDREDYSTPTARKLSLDYAIVKQMLSDIDLNHKFFFFEDDPKTFTDKEIEIISRNNNHDHQPRLVLYTREYFGKKAYLHFRGNLLEIGQTYLFRNKYKGNTLNECKKSFIQLYGGYKDESKRKPLDTKFDTFSKEVKYGETTYNYHLIDLLYWEVRLGRWICEVSNNHDNSFNTINPFNHRTLIDISLSFSYEKRSSEWFFKELINRNYPILNFYGDNTLENLYEQNKNLKSTVIKPEKPKFKSIYDKHFIKNNNETILENIPNQENHIYIPKKHLIVGNIAELEIPFNKENGIVHMALQSKFGSKEYKKYIHYEVLRNDSILLREDVSNWRGPNYISIPGLEKDDIVKIRVVVSKIVKESDHWEEATKIELLNYSEISSKMKDTNKINFSSPYSFRP